MHTSNGTATFNVAMVQWYKFEPLDLAYYPACREFILSFILFACGSQMALPAIGPRDGLGVLYLFGRIGGRGTSRERGPPQQEALGGRS